LNTTHLHDYEMLYVALTRDGGYRDATWC